MNSDICECFILHFNLFGFFLLEVRFTGGKDSCSVLVTQTGSNVLISEFVIGGLINFLQAVFIYVLRIYEVVK